MSGCVNRRTVVLATMMFLEYMAMPVWFVPMLPYVKSLQGGENWTLWCGLIMGIGTFASPLVGMFADRRLNAERVLAICYFSSAALLSGAFFVTSPALLFVLLLATMLFYMPTWALTATVAMAHASKDAFPRIRVFGTIGWICSCLFSLAAAAGGFEGFDSSPWIFAGGAVVMAAAGLFSFALPKTQPQAKGTPISVGDALGLGALVLLRDKSFRSFAILLLLAMIPFQWYNVYCAAYLKESGYQYLTTTMNIGQAGEIFFMLLVPLIFRRVGYRRALVLALVVLALRNIFFAVSSAYGFAALDFCGIVVHGLIFGLLVVGAQLFVDEVAPPELRNQAQGLVNLILAGVGVFASNFIFHAILKSSSPTPWTTAYVVAIAISLVTAIYGFVTAKKVNDQNRG
ncbi:MAG: MFS transporter [Kiritimatiellae bacterium]|nr:MFS transporter [Kiritimatiellia bacterium]